MTQQPTLKRSLPNPPSMITHSAIDLIRNGRPFKRPRVLPDESKSPSRCNFQAQLPKDSNLRAWKVWCIRFSVRRGTAGLRVF